MSDAPAIPAATLVVVRDVAGGPPELLMVERSAGMAFAAGALVFPGGRIDEADGAAGPAAETAAIRETLEETAIPVGLAPTPSPDAARALQAGLLAGQSFDGLLGEHELALEPGALTPLARWVPKFHASRRFDTLFFVARAPAGDWAPNVVAGECSGAFWITAAEALERDNRGEARMIFPTRRNLERLALHTSFEAIRADALGASRRADHALGRGDGWRKLHHHPQRHRLSGDPREARRAVARLIPRGLGCLLVAGAARRRFHLWPRLCAAPSAGCSLDRAGAGRSHRPVHAAKIAGLGEKPQQCRAMLAGAAVERCAGAASRVDPGLRL